MTSAAARGARSGPAPFLEREDVVTAIEYLASLPRLNIVTGTGTSAEMGFPLWDALVQRILEHAAQADDRLAKDDDRKRFATALLRQGPIAGASYAQAILGDRLDQVLASSLYAKVKSHGQVGEAALAVARLFRASGDESELVTLNYDLQLEQALELIGANPKPLRSGRKRLPKETVVRHLHGTLPLKGSAEDIVLSEAHYFDDRKKRWQEGFMASLLKQPTLFVGTSLNDPNLLRYLYTQKRSELPLHRAIFTVPEGERMFGGSQRSFEDAVNRRWRAAGVVPLHDEFYGQTTQFLHEVRLRRELGANYKGYKARLDAWSADMKGDLHQFGDPAAFAATQAALHQRLNDALESIRERVASLGIPIGSGERLGMELWSRLADERTLVRLASSSVIWNDAQAMVKAAISHQPPRPAVQAFAAGQGRLIDCSGDLSSPWMSLMALPIILDDHADYGRLPVGVLMLCSTLPLTESVLEPLRTQAPDIDTYLIGKPQDATGLGQQLLDPTGKSTASAAS